MPKRHVDKERIRISVAPPPDSALRQVDDVFIIITQAFCHNGHSLIAENDELFDDYPGIKFYLESDTNSGEVILSPIHGDASKKGKTDWKSGEKLKIMKNFSCGDENFLSFFVLLYGALLPEIVTVFPSLDDIRLDKSGLLQTFLYN